MSRRWSRRTERALALALVLSGCGGGGGSGSGAGGNGGGGGPTGAAAGQILFDRGSLGALVEAEPNDSVGQAHVLGTLRAAQRITVAGSLGTGSDVFDGFQVRAPQRVRITATLTVGGASVNDFDLSLYDPVSMQYLADFGTPTSPETGTFVEKGVFDLVVRRVLGAGPYLLTISADAAPSPVVEAEPNGSPTSAQPLGEVVPGDVVVVSGTAAAPADAVDAVLVGCPSAARLRFTLQMPAFTDYDLEVLDATGGLPSPAPLASFSSASANPETGVVDVPAGRLLVVEVRAASGSGSWTLTVRGDPPVVVTSALSAGTTRLPPLEREGERLRTPPTEGFAFGSPGGEFVAGEALARVEPGREAQARETVTRRGGRVAREEPGGYFVVRFDDALALGAEDGRRATLSRASGLFAPGTIDVAEPNRIRHVFSTTPDDPYYNLQWGYRTMRCPEAWDITTGSASVIVAVIDTGRKDHPDLAGRLSGGYDFVSDPSNANDGNGIDSDPTDPGGDGGGGSPSSFHATHVAGTIGAATDNGLGVSGVTWSCPIMHVRALGRFGGTDADIAQAIRYAAGLSNSSGTLPAARASVVNMSIGGYGSSQVLADACAAAHAAGVVLVAAAGNDSTTSPAFPASYPGVVSVMAVGYDLAKAFYSNTGSTIDVAAPGGDSSKDADGDGHADLILSTHYDDSGGTPVATYDYEQGTSMASPHVAGVAALILSVEPTLSPDEVESVLGSTAKDLGAPGKDTTFGWGLVDAYEAVRSVVATPVVLPPVLSLSATSLDFDVASTSRDVLVRNAGSGLLHVGPVAVATDSGGPWLSAALLGGDARTTAGTLRATVDRAGLLEGTYFGTIDVASDGGSAQVLVVMTVQFALPPPPNVDVIVRAVSAATGRVVQENSVNPTSTLSWNFSALPAGDYVFVAGSDFDHDGTIGEDGDYFGYYGTEGRPTLVHVGAGASVPNVDFRVSLDSPIGVSAAGVPPGIPAPGR